MAATVGPMSGRPHLVYNGQSFNGRDGRYLVMDGDTVTVKGATRGGAALGGGHRPLREVVADELRRRILDAQLAQGSRVIEDRVAAELGVSRNPVREAIRLLESEGLVEVTPRRGVIVAVITPREAADLVEVRVALEATAVRRAAVHGVEPETLAALAATLAEGEQAVRTGQFGQLPSLNARFHGLLARASGNRRLVEILDDLQNRLQMMFSTGVTRRSGSAWAEHRRILTAVRAGDADWAEAELRSHVSGAARRYLDPGEQPADTGPADHTGPTDTGPASAEPAEAEPMGAALEEVTAG